jgi:hypothetical protein
MAISPDCVFLCLNKRCQPNKVTTLQQGTFNDRVSTFLPLNLQWYTTEEMRTRELNLVSVKYAALF